MHTLYTTYMLHLHFSLDLTKNLMLELKRHGTIDNHTRKDQYRMNAKTCLLNVQNKIGLIFYHNR